MAVDDAYVMLCTKEDRFRRDAAEGLDSRGKLLAYAFELAFFACFQLVAIRKALEPKL
jgi:hypothetical protein